ncbi:MAG: hypothetical protein ABI262_24915 [Microcoleus sp.]|jgi:hypothetical protein
MRRSNDFYATESAVTKVLLDKVSLISIAGSISEPCAGDGAIVDVLCDEHTTNVYTNDIDPQWHCDSNFDASNRDTWEHWRDFNRLPNWTITNPPFNQAHLILPLAYEYSAVGVAFLLRLSYLEPAGERGGNRGEWLQSHSQNLSNLIIFGQPRPSFTGNNKTDLCTVAWMVWMKHHRSGTKVDFVFDWKQ